MLKIFIFTCMFLMVTSTNAKANSEYVSSEKLAPMRIELDSQDRAFNLSNSRFHLERDGDVSILLVWEDRRFCDYYWGGYDPRYPRYPRYPRTCTPYQRRVIAPVQGLRRVGDQVIYSAGGMRTVCASISTRTNWLGNRVISFYPNGNCRVRVATRGYDRVVYLVVR